MPRSVAGSSTSAVANMPGARRESRFRKLTSIIIAREFGSIATFLADTAPENVVPGYADTSARTGMPGRSCAAWASGT